MQFETYGLQHFLILYYIDLNNRSKTYLKFFYLAVKNYFNWKCKAQIVNNVKIDRCKKSVACPKRCIVISPESCTLRGRI